MPELSNRELEDQLRAWADDLAAAVPEWSPQRTTLGDLSPLRPAGFARRLLGAAALIGALVAGGLWWSGSAGDDRVDSGPADTPRATDLELPPAVRLRAAIDATLSSTSWVATGSLVRSDGTLVRPGDDPSAPILPEVNRITTYQAPGLVSFADQTLDHEMVTNLYLDLEARREYWSPSSGVWKSSAWTDGAGLDPRHRYDTAPGPEACVYSVGAHALRVAGRDEHGMCPTAMPSFDTTTTYLREFAFTRDGRLASVTEARDERGMPTGPTASARFVVRYTDYDSAPPVHLPDPSTVEEVDARGLTWSSDASGHLARPEATCWIDGQVTIDCGD